MPSFADRIVILCTSKRANDNSYEEVADKLGFRFSKTIEFELAKFLNTVGFKRYGSVLWDLAAADDVPPRSEPLSAPIVAQILDQVRHDPSVAASGEEPIPFLRQTKRNLLNHWGVNAATLIGEHTDRPEALFVIPELGTYHEDLVANVAQSLRSLGCRSFLIVVTDQDGASTGSVQTSSIPDARVIFWRKHSADHSPNISRPFATFIHVLGPAVVMTSGSALGLAAIGRYGRALKEFHRLFCSFDAPGPRDPASFREIHHLRLTAPYATTLTFDEQNANIIRKHSDSLEASTSILLTPDKDKDELVAIFGEDFGDRRPALGVRVIGSLIAPPSETKPAATHDTISPTSQPEPAAAIDISVTIVFHGEKELTVPALASLADMVDVARKSGLKVEARAMLDRADEQTRRLVERHGAYLDHVTEVSFGDLGLTRNAGVELARGRYLSFLDGDDLWGSQWLRAAYEAATDSDAPKDAIWHPASLLTFFSSDCDKYVESKVPHPKARSSYALHQASDWPDFEKRDLLLENQWSANCFARTDVFRRFPYRPNDWQRQIGIEDWRWNLETLGSGLRHFVVADTVHIIRIKDAGSLGTVSETFGLLPVLI